MGMAGRDGELFVDRVDCTRRVRVAQHRRRAVQRRGLWRCGGQRRLDGMCPYVGGVAGHVLCC